MEEEKIAVTSKSMHFLLCARNGASKMSYKYDGTNINQYQSQKESTHKCMEEKMNNQNDAIINLFQNNPKPLIQTTILQNNTISLLKSEITVTLKK